MTRIWSSFREAELIEARRLTTKRHGLAQSGSSESHLILNMMNVHMRIDAKERRCGDAEGNRLTKTPVQQANPNPVSVLSQYSYDAIYELTQAVVNGSVAEGYTYDAVGSRLTSAGPVSYNYNTSNELTSTSAATYAYDNNGNTTSKTTSAGTTSYTWDFENRLASVTLPGTGGTVNFEYDPFGRRIYKSSPAGTYIYVYDGADVIQELGSSGNLLSSYTQGLGVDQPLALYQGAGTSYFHADGLGSVTSLTDPTGAVATSYVYDSFGNLTASTGTATNPFQYTGREIDSETGLYYYRARYYDPTVGRFLSEDPLGFTATVNFYTYAHDNPALAVDPLGLSSLVFNPQQSTLQLYAGGGENLIATCQAKNLTALGSGGPWPSGTFQFQQYNWHPANPKGSFGSYGIFVFSVPGRTGMGVHSGRRDQGGPAHPTLGCIRTDDACMQQIWEWNQFDPVEEITVQ